MAVIKEITITVNNNKATLDKPIFLYLGDGDITFLIKVLETQYTIGTFPTSANIIEKSDLVYANICIQKPDKTVVKSRTFQIIDDKIRFEMAKDLLNELTEQGQHYLQIHLYDSDMVDANRYTIPPVSITVEQPICYPHDITGVQAYVDFAGVDISEITSRVIVINNYDEEGNYNKTIWKYGDLITKELLNKIEEVIFDNTADIIRIKKDLYKDGYITCWGDDLSVDGWPNILQNLTGLMVYNASTLNENSACILARQGGDAMLINNVTIPGDNTLPAVTIATKSSGGITTELENKVSPLLYNSLDFNPCYIGEIKGTLVWSGTSPTDNNGVWKFTRAIMGVDTVINRPTAIRTNYDINKNSPLVMIIFMGQNGGYTNIRDLIKQHKLMIEHSNAQEIIILGLSSGTAEERYDYETAMKKEFGRYFISLRKYLSTYGLGDAGITPTTADTDAMKLGKVPPSLLTDTVHYNDVCKNVIANMLYKKIVELNIL